MRASSGGPRRLAFLTALTLVGACSSTTPSPSPSGASPAPPPATNPASLPESSRLTPSIASPAPSAGASSAASSSTVASFDPARFSATVDNPWLPFKPGTKMVYRGIRDGEPAVDTVTVTNQTKIVDGVPCVVVHDELTLSGTLAERTDDWYTQDGDGNVWYFGEATAELDAAGKVTSTEGSWEAGVNGGTPGIFMPASPQIGNSYSQEYLAGQAEDHFVVLLTDTPVKVPAGSYPGTLLTAEWTPLEPKVLTEKHYATGVGEVREADVVGGDERLELVSIAGG